MLKTYRCKNCNRKYNNFIVKDKNFCSKDCFSSFYLNYYRFNRKKLIYILNQGKE